LVLHIIIWRLKDAWGGLPIAIVRSNKIDQDNVVTLSFMDKLDMTSKSKNSFGVHRLTNTLNYFFNNFSSSLATASPVSTVLAEPARSLVLNPESKTDLTASSTN